MSAQLENLDLRFHYYFDIKINDKSLYPRNEIERNWWFTKINEQYDK